MRVPFFPELCGKGMRARLECLGSITEILQLIDHAKTDGRAALVAAHRDFHRGNTEISATWRRRVSASACLPSARN
jgi:hypothetical protein